eukprot:10089436-Lingulodinium_polyedra.AAC.1
MKEAIFLCWDNTTVQGAFVLTEKEGKKLITATSGPVPWPAKVPEEKWKAKYCGKRHRIYHVRRT